MWLRTRTVWEGKARQREDDDGKSQRWELSDQDEALAMVNKPITPPLAACAPDLTAK